MTPGTCGLSGMIQCCSLLAACWKKDNFNLYSMTTVWD